MATKPKKLKIFSDCASYNNGRKDPDKPMIGAYYSCILDENDEILLEFTDFYEDTTNNQMELFGFIRAGYEFLKRHKSNQPYIIEVWSDSQYLIKSTNEYLPNWKRNGWKSSSGEVKNKDLWLIINALIDFKKPMIQFDFKWVKGHKGKSVKKEDDLFSYYNELCDSNANKTLKSFLEGMFICPENEFENIIERIKTNLRIE